jgi:long-chain acyl-CoA synthetase
MEVIMQGRENNSVERTLSRRHPWLGVDAIAHNARVYPNSLAVVCGERRLTWPEFHERVNRIANGILSLGLERNDKVAIVLSNSVEFLELFWGIVRAGCVAVPVNTMLTSEVVVRVLNSCDARLVFAEESTADQIDAERSGLAGVTGDRLFCIGPARDGWGSSEELIAAASPAPPAVVNQPDDAMTIMYSSGSTGVPKGIEHTHEARMVYPLGFGMGLKVDRYSVAVVTTPMHASGSWITIFPVMYRGGTVVLMPKYTPEEFLDIVEREGATHTFMVPTMYIALLQAPDLAQRDTKSLRVLLTSGQALATATAEALQAACPNSDLYECYGLTEGVILLRLPEDADHGKYDSVGKPLLLDEVRIIDGDGKELPQGESGEIVGYGLGVMTGYYNEPERTAGATWISPEGIAYLRTGDIGWIDPDGFLFLAGRLKDMIKSGGINIYAVDIEDVFMRHPSVKEAAAIAVPHEKWGETPLLVVVAEQDVEVDADELREWGNQRLSKYQRVSRIVVQDDMPRATYGKIHKDRLRQQFAGPGADDQAKGAR